MQAHFKESLMKTKKTPFVCPLARASEQFDIPESIIMDLWNLDWPTKLRVAKYLDNPKIRVQA